MNKITYKKGDMWVGGMSKMSIFSVMQFTNKPLKMLDYKLICKSKFVPSLAFPLHYSKIQKHSISTKKKLNIPHVIHPFHPLNIHILCIHYFPTTYGKIIA